MAELYDRSNSWRWNLEHPPVTAAEDSEQKELSLFPGQWNWCGIPVNSPLGVAAGPLLNGAWLRAYASRGFDILVYKTVRTSQRECYDLPNLVPVEVDNVSQPDGTVSACDAMQGSWAVSFGMPSVAVAQWQSDVATTRAALRPGQLLVVSVVGTQTDCSTPEASLEQLANDFAECAQLACEAGAHGIEANFSCPNVNTDDGQLFQNPQSAAVVAERIRDAIGTTPLVLKIGFTDSPEHAAQLLRSVAPFVNGLAMTNAISARVRDDSGLLLFSGATRGICGKAIRMASIKQVRMFADLIRSHDLSLQIVGVGGIFTLNDVDEYLEAGASSVALATAAMLDPNVALTIRRAKAATCD